MPVHTVRRFSRRVYGQAVLAWAITASVSPRVVAQTGPASQTQIKQLIVDAVDQEIRFLHYGEPYLRYRMHVIDAKGDQIREVVQSRDGAVARLMARDNRALTPEEDQAERERLQGMLDSPDAFQRHVKGDIGSKKNATDMIRHLPDAMIYTLVEGQPQRPGANHTEIVIDYTPDPAWNPPTMTSAALTGIQGRVWLDAKTHTLVAIDGHIFRGINFGLGMLAHIYPGGELHMEQSEVVPGRWSFRHFVEHATVRALMVKTIHEDVNTNAWDFAAVNPMSYQEAIRMLLAIPLPQQLATP